MLRRLWGAVDRWGPAAVSVLTLLAVVAFWLVYDGKVARTEGQLVALQYQVDGYVQLELSHRQEVAALKNWIIAVYERGSARGWDMPPLPETTQQRKKQENQKNKKSGTERR